LCLFVSRVRCTLLVILGVVPLAAAGCGDAATDQIVEPVSFRADAGPKAQPYRSSGGQTILDLGELTVRASCNRGEGGRAFMSVTASTGVDNALVSSRFTQAGSRSTSYAFVLDDFDRDYGQWDILGETEKAAGTLTYSRADGGQVALPFAASSGTGPVDCFFGGVATYAPPP
jgi:hypothetical protein